MKSLAQRINPDALKKLWEEKIPSPVDALNLVVLVDSLLDRSFFDDLSSIVADFNIQIFRPLKFMDAIPFVKISGTNH